MSENIQNTPNNNDPKSNEIDLRELFRMIGKGFSSLFAFLRNTLLFLLDLLIRALIVIRVHIVKFVIVGILSVAIGWFVDSRKPVVYGSNLYVKTNYDSSKQLYSNISFYNSLAENGDVETLSKIFEIDTTDARNLQGFYIEPDITENQNLISFDNFLKDKDSLTVSQIDFNKFKSNIDPKDYDSHRIGVASVERNIFPSLQEKLITYNIENELIKRKKENFIQNLNIQEKSLLSRLTKIDTLRNVYNESILSESKKTSNAQTTIQMSSNTKKTNEIELFNLDEKIASQLVIINQQRRMGEKTIDVISDFYPGIEVKNFFDSYLFKIPIVTLSLLLLFILLRELNKYLDAYAENKRINA